MSQSLRTRTSVFLFFAVFATNSFAQSQQSSGDCSPNVADVRGNVTITCGEVNDQLEVPTIEGHFSDMSKDKDFAAINESIAINERKIIFVDLFLSDDLVDIYESVNDFGFFARISLHNESEFGVETTYAYVIDALTDTEQRKVLSWASGRYRLTGYFIPQQLGMNFGQITSSLTQVSASEVLLR